MNKINELELEQLQQEYAKLKSVVDKGGLVWRDYPEENEKKDYTITLNKELSFLTKEVSDNKIIEGDNLLALRELQKTHKSKIDVIYIDPPYNTGNEFVYNDKIVNKEDGYRHSKWLSFMSKRLKLAQRLLSDDGVIFVSIDDNEQAQLKLLMDSIFGEKNFVSTLIWKQKSGGSNNTKGVVIETEYIHCYTKKYGTKYNRQKVNTGDYKLEDEYVDTRGKYKLKQLDFSSLGYIPSLDFPIYSSEHGKNAYPGGGIEENKIKKARWRWGKDKVDWGLSQGYIVFKENKEGVLQVYTKQYENVDNEGKPIERKNPYRNFIDFVNTARGNREMKELFSGTTPFSYPKPVDLIKHILKMSPVQENAVVLDFFAGSGTTGHAVLELNKEDGGNRKFILCTNNEVSEEKVRQHFIKQGLLDKNNKTAFNKFKEENESLVQEFLDSEAYQELGIARSVTRERIKKVSEGYVTPKGKEVKGLGGDFEYYIVE